MNTFKQYDAKGSELEDLLEGLLKQRKANYKRNVAIKGDLTEQHKGDFYLPKYGIYLECKNDLLFERYGNLYFELGEVRDETAPKDPKTVQAIGIAKHAFKAPTVMVHQIGEDRFAVYGARLLTERLLIGKRVTGLHWNEKKDVRMDRLDKTNCSLLWAGVDERDNAFMNRAILWATKDNLLKRIAQVAEEEMKAPAQNERVILDLMHAHRAGFDWQRKGWNDYDYQVPGEGSFGQTYREFDEDDWFEAAKTLVLS